MEVVEIQLVVVEQVEVDQVKLDVVQEYQELLILEVVEVV